jgi:chemotaxis signal transduction protein
MVNQKRSRVAYQDQVHKKIQERVRYTQEHGGVEHAMYVGFVCQGARYLIEGWAVSSVSDVGAIEPFPSSKPWALGVVNVQGMVYTVADLAILAGAERARSRFAKLLIIDRAILAGAALLVESLDSVVDDDELGTPFEIPGGRPRPWMACNHEIRGERYTLIDAKALLSHPDLANLQNIGELT